MRNKTSKPATRAVIYRFIRFFLLLFTLHVSLFIASGRADERIVTLSPAINEMVFALGAGNEVVGTTTYATYPDAAKKLPRVGGYFSPSLERIVALRPTLVVMQGDNPRLADRLRRLRIETMTLPIDTMAHIKEAFLRLGARLHKEQEARAVVARIDKALAALRTPPSARNTRHAPLRILIVIGQPTDLKGRIFVVGHNLYFQDIIEASGNLNAVPPSVKGQPVFSRENLIAAAPDLVVILAPFMRQKGLSEKALIAPWLKLPVPAATRGDVYVIGKSYAGIPSDRVIDFINDFREIIHAAYRHTPYR